MGLLDFSMFAMLDDCGKAHPACLPFGSNVLYNMHCIVLRCTALHCTVIGTVKCLSRQLPVRLFWDTSTVQTKHQDGRELKDYKRRNATKSQLGPEMEMDG